MYVCIYKKFKGLIAKIKEIWLKKWTQDVQIVFKRTYENEHQKYRNMLFLTSHGRIHQAPCKTTSNPAHCGFHAAGTGTTRREEGSANKPALPRTVTNRKLGEQAVPTVHT